MHNLSKNSFKTTISESYSSFVVAAFHLFRHLTIDCTAFHCDLNSIVNDFEFDKSRRNSPNHLPKCIGFIVLFDVLNITMSHRFDFGNLIKHTAIVGEITLFTFDIVFDR